MNVMPWRRRELERLVLSGLDRKKPPRKAHPHVESLYLSRLAAPDFSLFPNLREITLRAVPELPAVLRALNELPHLDSLDLHAMPLATLPEELRAMTRLRWLVLDDLELETLPPWIGELGALEALSLEHNPLTELPEELCALTSLQALVLGCWTSLDTKRLQRLPRSIERWPLRYLYLYETELGRAAIERLLHLPALRHLGMYGAELPQVVGELTRLESLSIEDWPYTAVPDFVGELTELRELRLLLLPLREVPAWLPRLQKLERIFVHTKIEMDLLAFIELAVQLPKVQLLYLWGAAPKAAKKKLDAAGFEVVRGNWHVWVRGEGEEIRPSAELYPWR